MTILLSGKLFDPGPVDKHLMKDILLSMKILKVIFFFIQYVFQPGKIDVLEFCKILNHDWLRNI